MKTFDELQGDFVSLVKDWMRHELGKEWYQGKVQAVVVTTNTVTGKVNIDTCNVNLIADAKKMLREGYDQLDRSQMVNALLSIIRKEITDAKVTMGLRASERSRNKKSSAGSGQGKGLSRKG